MSKSLYNMLNELLQTKSTSIDKLAVQSELNPNIWQKNNFIIPEIRKKLLYNAIEFIKFANIDDFTYNDIILTGSMANFNWNENSDLDIHIIMDYNKIAPNIEFVEEYFNAKRRLWATKYSPTIYTHPVEIYVEDVNKPAISTGVYSLMKNEWIVKPTKKIIIVDDVLIAKKVNAVIDVIDDIENIENNKRKIDLINYFLEKLKKYRKIGLTDGGEFSTENLVFKILRNDGYLNKLFDLKIKIMTNLLSIE